MDKKRVLFVSAGNPFESRCAQCALDKYLADNNIKGWEVSCANAIASRPIRKELAMFLESIGAKTSVKHDPPLTKLLGKNSDAVIVMARKAADDIKRKFELGNCVAFEELAKYVGSRLDKYRRDGIKLPKDLGGLNPKYQRIVREIFKATPSLFDSISERFFLFSDFANGLKKHRNGYPFIKLYETKNTISFMSLDIPQKEDGHILVIPKKRFPDIADTPAPVLNEMILSVKHIGAALSKNHSGYNVLVNCGKDAGQYIFHTHFHIIPRRPSDHFKIEVWPKQKISRKRFIELNKRLKKQIDKS